MSGRLASLEELAALREQLRNEQAAAPSAGRIPVRICMGASCIASGAVAVRQSLEEELAAAGLEGRVALKDVGCLGPCSGGPVAVVGDVFYEHLQPEHCAEIVRAHLGKGQIVERLAHRRPDGRIVSRMEDMEFFRRQTKIVLGRCGRIDPQRIDDTLIEGGYQALAGVLDAHDPEAVLREMEVSGLRGRGGAGFPTWRKWSFARNAPGRQKFVVCNADEGDPGAFMDRSMLEGDPHKVLEGMIIGAYAMGSDEGYIYCRAEYPLAIKHLNAAIKAAQERNYLGNNILGTGFSFKLHIKEGAGAFVCGEETALIHSIEGKRGMPTIRPPFPAERGLWDKPTNINNVETWANIAWIIQNGAKAFRQMGTQRSPGTKVFALAGMIAGSGLIEIPMGMTLGDIIYKVGGGMKTDKPFKALQIGGPSGGCVPADLLDTIVDYDSITATGAIMGSGGMVVMDTGTCMVDVARYFLNFTQNESCGKCTFCRIGTRRMLEILTRITEGRGVPEDLDKLEDLAKNIIKGSLCGLGQSAPNPVLTTLKYFRDEYLAHINDKRCPAGVCTVLLRFEINPDKCIGCTACARACPVNCISGYVKKPHLIDQSQCIQCGQCYKVCKFDAITKG